MECRPVEQQQIALTVKNLDGDEGFAGIVDEGRGY